MAYARVATDDPDDPPAPHHPTGAGYPPTSPPTAQPSSLPSFSSPPTSRWRFLRFAPRPMLALLSAVVLVHYLTLLISVHVDPSPSRDWIQPDTPPPFAAWLPSHSNTSDEGTGYGAGYLAASDGGAGTPLRDATPIATALRFLALAEAEVAALGLDTCDDEIGRAMVDAAAKRRVVYCAGAEGDDRMGDGEEEGDEADDGGEWEGVTPGDDDDYARLKAAAKRDARIECMPFRPLVSPPHASATDAGAQSDATSANSSSPDADADADADAIVPDWWPGTTPPCISQYLRPVHRISQRNFVAPGCGLTRSGEALRHPAPDAFVGTSIIDEEAARCRRVLGHTVVFVQRQDQWNPFHVAEDLIMTLVSLIVAGTAVPALTHHRLQLVFSDNFGLDGNRFAGVWDRVGAIPPRRTRHEPFDDGTCLTTAIHAMYGRTSLLSASGVGRPYDCASTLSWAAAHYYRHLFGLSVPPLRLGQVPGSKTESESGPQPESSTSQQQSTSARTPSPAGVEPINILYVSRGRLRHHLGNDFGHWQKYRELENESEMVARWRRGLREMCEGGAEEGGDGEGEGGGEKSRARACDFIDADEYPETWAASPTSNSTASSDSTTTRRQIRFASIDPLAHTLETQVHLAGHATILVGQHGGALGLSLFLPPGRGAILELAVPLVRRNYHFQHMASQMGHLYRVRGIRPRVNVEHAWDDLREMIEAVEERWEERATGKSHMKQ